MEPMPQLRRKNKEGVREGEREEGLWGVVASAKCFESKQHIRRCFVWGSTM